MIRLQDITRIFGSGDERTDALRGIDQTINAGEFVTGVDKAGVLECDQAADGLLSNAPFICGGVEFGRAWRQ